MKPKSSFIGGLLLVFISQSVNAQFVNLSFTHSDGSNKNAEIGEWISPKSSVTVNLISGLDNKEKIVIKRISNNEEVFSYTTDTVTVADRMKSSNGEEYYGKSVEIPLLSDDLYLITNETIDNKGSVVSKTTGNYRIDTVKPLITSQIVWNRAGHNNGSVEVFGHAVATRSLSISGVSDIGAGISHADWFTIDDKGVRRSVKADINLEAKTVTALGAVAAGKTVAPEDQASYTVGFKVYDKAGNFTEISRRSTIDRLVPTDLQRQVYNDKSGTWEIYKDDMVIYANPVKIRFRMLKKDHAEFNGTDYGWYGFVSSTDEDNVYYNTTLSYPESYRYISIYTKAGLQKTTQLSSYKFTLEEGVEIAPKYLKGTAHFKNKDSWTPTDTVKYSNEEECVDEFITTVEKRTYKQVVTIAEIGNCSIDIGENTCSIKFNLCKNSGKGYKPYSLSVNGSGDYKSLGSLKSYMYVYWDYNAPVIDSVKIDNSNKTVIMQVTDKDTTNDWTNALWVTNTFNLKLTDENLKEKTLKPSKISVINYQQKEVTFNYSTLPSAKYTGEVSATDEYNNTATDNLPDDIIHDTTPPIVQVLFENKDVNGQVIRGLENLDIFVSDNLSTPTIKSITLDGGPVADKVNLGWYSINKDKIALQYPRVFPSTDEKESYNLTITAEDDSGNRTVGKFNFRYVPNNLIELGGVKTFAIDQPLDSTDDKPLSFLKANNIRRSNGALLTGYQLATMTVRKDSSFGLKINDEVILPGYSKDIQVNFNNGDGVLIPIYPSESGKTGKAFFILDFPQIN